MWGPGESCQTWSRWSPTCPERSPPPAPSSAPYTASGWEHLQKPFFTVCLFSILNEEYGQPTQLNNLDTLFLMLSLAGEIKDGFVRSGGGCPKATQAHSDSQWKSPIYQSVWSTGQLPGYQLGLPPPAAHLSEMRPDVLMICKDSVCLPLN